MNPKVGSGGAPTVWWVRLSLSSLLEGIRHVMGAKARWFVCSMPVSLAACGDSCPTSFEGLNPSGDSLSAPWTDTGIAQGRVLSPLLFNLLVNGLAASVRQAAPGVQFGVSHRFTDQLYADDLVVTCWGHQWRFSFGIGPTSLPLWFLGLEGVSLLAQPSSVAKSCPWSPNIPILASS